MQYNFARSNKWIKKLFFQQKNSENPHNNVDLKPLCFHYIFWRNMEVHITWTLLA